MCVSVCVRAHACVHVCLCVSVYVRPVPEEAGDALELEFGGICELTSRSARN